MENKKSGLASCRLYPTGKIHLVSLQGTGKQVTFCGRRLSASQRFSDEKQFDRGEHCCAACLGQLEEVCDSGLQKNRQIFC